MANTLRIPRAHLIMALILPLAVILGYFIVDPMEPSSLTVLGLVLAALALPLMMQWYHPLLIILWNAAMSPAFLPGQPPLWMPVAMVGLLISLLNRSVNQNARFNTVPAINQSLICLTLVVLVTAYFTGGIGSQIFGSATFGGRRYFYTFLAVIGYFVMTSQRIPAHRAGWITALFFLSALTSMVPDILGLAGNSTSFLYAIFPPDFSAVEAVTGESASNEMYRIFGLTLSSAGLLFGLLVRYGIRGVFAPGKIWRAALFVLAFAACLYSGFRSFLVLMGLVFVVQFFLEGLHRTRSLAILLGVSLVGLSVVLTQAEKLPLVVQRTLSVLPVKISTVAKMSAEGSSEWRLEMWKAVLPEVPKHLLLGKGYSINSTDMYFANDNSNRANQSFHWAVVTGDYHSGPLSLIIPFGLWGVLAFGWFCWASLRYLYHNYRTGPPEWRIINTFLLSCFVGRLIFFLFVFGGFYGDLFIFTGIIGLSVSLNGRTREISIAPEAEPQTDEELLAEVNADRDNYP